MSEDKKYVHVSRDTVRLCAEQAGIQDVNDEAFGMVAEDCGYRLREATALAAQFMRKNRRRKLTTEDFNKALMAYDVEPIVGFGAASSIAWKQIPRDPTASPEGTTPLYFPDDRELNVLSLSINAATVANIEVRAPLSVTSHWLTQEQYPRILTPAGVTATNATAMSASSMSPSLTSSSPQPHGSPTRKPSSSSAALQQKKINDALLAYYEAATKAILSKDEALMKAALADLRTNPRIGPLLPYLVNFVSTGVKTLAHDVGQLKKLLHTIKALLHNRQLDLTPKPYLELLLTSTLQCLMEPPGASNGSGEHWTLRDYAARILTLIVDGWGRQLPYIKEMAMKSLQDAFYDASRPLCSVYGAVVGTSAMGATVSQSYLLPHLNSCVARLESQEPLATNAAKWARQVDVYHVRGALILAVEKYLKEKSGEFRHDVIQSIRERAEKKESDDHPGSKMELKMEDSVVKSAQPDINTVYRDSYHHFGSSLASRLDQVMNRPRVQRDEKPKIPVCLYDDSNEERNGEDMLSELKQQAAEEQKKRLKEEDEEEEDDEERSYESDEKSDQNGEFDEESVVVKSQISDPGQGIKLTLKLTKRSRTDTHSSIASGDAASVDGLAPPHKKKKRSRSSRESSAHIGSSSGNTPSPASPHRAGRDEPVFQGGGIRFSRPPKIDFRVLGMNARDPWDLARAPPVNLSVDAATCGEPLWWKRSGERRLPSMNRVSTAKMKTLSDTERRRRIDRSCSLFSIL